MTSNIPNIAGFGGIFLHIPTVVWHIYPTGYFTHIKLAGFNRRQRAKKRVQSGEFISSETKSRWFNPQKMLVQPPDSLNTKYTRCTKCVPLIESTALTNYKLQWHWLGFWKGSKEQFLTFHPHSEPGWLLHSWGCAATSSLEQVTSSLPPRATASKLCITLSDTARGTHCTVCAAKTTQLPWKSPGQEPKLF